MDATIPGKMVIGFSTVQDCEAVIQSIRASHPDWSVEHTDPQFLSQVRISFPLPLPVEASPGLTYHFGLLES